VFGAMAFLLSVVWKPSSGVVRQNSITITFRAVDSRGGPRFPSLPSLIHCRHFPTWGIITDGYHLLSLLGAGRSPLRRRSDVIFEKHRAGSSRPSSTESSCPTDAQ